MQLCGVTRVLLVATVVGLAVATVTASDWYGWIAAVAVGVLFFVVPAVREATRSCPVPVSRSGAADEDAVPDGPDGVRRR